MSQILDGLLRLSSAEAIEPSHAGTVNLTELIRQRLDQFTAHAEAQQVELRYEAQSSALVAAETGDLETVLDNPACVALMEKFIADHPALWNEDIGE